MHLISGVFTIITTLYAFVLDPKRDFERCAVHYVVFVNVFYDFKLCTIFIVDDNIIITKMLRLLL